MIAKADRNTMVTPMDIEHADLPDAPMPPDQDAPKDWNQESRPHGDDTSDVTADDESDVS